MTEEKIMKIGFQSSIVDDNLTGLGTYAKNLLHSYAAMNKSDQICEIHYPRLKHGTPTERKDVVVPVLPLHLSKVIGIPLAIKKCDMDLMHFPVHRCDDFFCYYLNAQIKKILTVHDLIPFIYPREQDFQTRYLWTTSLKLIAREISFIIADSENTKNDCIRYLNFPQEKIRVIPLAANKIFRPAPNKEAVTCKVWAKLGISVPFIFYTGSLIQRKNIQLLIEVFSKLKAKGYRHKLVISGTWNPYSRELFEATARLGMNGEIIFTGYLPEQELVDFYNAAQVFVYPSMYEGFGIPPLEAMACGTPVIASNISSIPEVVGDAGKLINPCNSKELEDALEVLILDEGYCAELSKKGIARSGTFSWSRTGKETWNVYEEIKRERDI